MEYDRIDRRTKNLIEHYEMLQDNPTNYWKCINSLLRKHKNLMFQSPSNKNLSKLLMDRLLQVNCDDKNVMTTILSMYIHQHRFNSLTVVDNLRAMNVALQKGDALLVKTLIKYGLVNTALCEENEFNQPEGSVNNFWFYSMDPLCESLRVRQNCVEYLNFMRKFIVLMKDIKDDPSYKQGICRRGGRRVFLVARLLHVLMQENPSRVQEFAKCFRMYFCTIPDPFIAVEELLEFLRVVYMGKMKVEAENSVTATYRTLFPLESSTPFQPRSLKHLCRCSVRNVLAERSATLPVLVKGLRIPETLKDLLLGGLEV